MQKIIQEYCEGKLRKYNSEFELKVLEQFKKNPEHSQGLLLALKISNDVLKEILEEI